MLELAILGVLREQPMHGYELRHYLSFIVGHIWQLSYGTLYPALRRLEKRGELTRTTVRDGRGPEKHVYGLTPKGEATFLTLMEAIGSPTEISDPHKFTIRLIFFRALSSEKRRELLQARIDFLNQTKATLSEMAEMPSSALDRYRTALLRHHERINAEEIALLTGMLADELPPNPSLPGRASGASISPL